MSIDTWVARETKEMKNMWTDMIEQAWSI